MKHITPETANEIYDLLVSRVGAAENWRDDFVMHMKDGTREYRFQGSLGFGGKFYNDHKWRINCYPEDATEERTRLIFEVNEILHRMEVKA